MHRLRTIPGGWNPGVEGVIDIDQTPGDIIFLSSGDTELSTFVEAYRATFDKTSEISSSVPSLRVVNLGSLKQELTIDNYIDDVVAHAKLVVARLLGGFAYYPYLVEQVQGICEAKGIPLIWLPGYNEPDPILLERSLQVEAELYQTVWEGFNLAGAENLKQAVARLINRYFRLDLPVEPYWEIPDIFLFEHDKLSSLAKPDSEESAVVGLVVYRAHYLANNMAPFESLIRALKQKGLCVRCVLAHTLRDSSSVQSVLDILTDSGSVELSLLINTTSFSTKSIRDGMAQSGFAVLDVPVIQAMVASCTCSVWEAGDFGLPPTDIAMNVALPEVDGRIIARPISFKLDYQRDASTESDLTCYEIHAEGIEFVASLTASWVRLRTMQPKERRIAIVLPNYPNKDARLANGVGLDTPASVVKIIGALDVAGYDCGDDLPTDSDALMQRLTQSITNDQETLDLKQCEVTFDDAIFQQWLSEQSPTLPEKVRERWGACENDPYLQDGAWRLSGILLGNLWVAIQPARGFNINLAESYHCPDLPPPWNYLAFYCYLRHGFGAHAVVHVGKHGNLEWLPGKSLALSPQSCFPAMLLPPVPHLYPFIVNDPGEGTQAKRRNQAVIIDHLMPPMTRAEVYGPLVELEQTIDEYYECADLDPERKCLLEGRIRDLVVRENLDADLSLKAGPLGDALVQVDAYLCELKEAQIRDGLHILGGVPEGRLLVDTLVALHRMPTGDGMGITQALADDLKLGIDPLHEEYGASVKTDVFPSVRNVGDLVEVLEQKATELVEAMLKGQKMPESLPMTREVLEQIQVSTLPNIRGSESEIGSLLHGLNGGFIDSGPSGAPTRGRLDVLPTGRNFYSVDLRAIPTKAAWELGRRSAERVVQRYVQEQGEYPSSISLTVWGTSTMRTGGDDIAQALALMGVRPMWQGMNQRIVDFEVLSLIELGRPRVDVTLRISGFFRDAFPDLISFFQSAVKKVAEEDEPGDENPLRRAYLDESSEWKRKGFDARAAKEQALYRVFGSKPGSYGAGLQELIANRNWETHEDLAQAYLNWSCYAYDSRKRCKMVPEVFKKRLVATQVVLQNQDNREHDILDSDDYYQFQGGMANAATVFSGGEEKQIYFGDHSRPENPRIKTLKEEILKVYRSRVVNPKWIDGIKRHGYKGAFEMAATLDYVFGYASTTDAVEDFVFEGIAKAYLFDAENRAFVEKHNPWALKDMAERLLEAMERKIWKAPPESMREALETIVLESEGIVEDRLDV